MAEWIGHFIANWPLWAIIFALIIVSVLWFLYYFTTTTDHLWNKKEWWQDRAKRLEKEAKLNRTKNIVKKG